MPESDLLRTSTQSTPAITFRSQASLPASTEASRNSTYRDINDLIISLDYEQAIDYINTPLYLNCILSKCLMRDPVMIVTGSIYDREYIERHFVDKKTDPLSATVLNDNTLTPVRNLRDAIITFLNSQECKNLVEAYNIANPTSASINEAVILFNANIHRTKDELINYVSEQKNNSDELLKDFVYRHDMIFYTSKHMALDKNEYLRLKNHLRIINSHLAFMQQLIVDDSDDSDDSDDTKIGIFCREMWGSANKHFQISKNITSILLALSDADPVSAQDLCDKLIQSINEPPKLIEYDDIASDNKLLSIAYNLKAKIASNLQGNNMLAEECYKDASTYDANNHVSKANHILLLIDRGIAEKDPYLYLEAYTIYNDSQENFYLIQDNLLPTIDVKIAKGLLLLARCIEKEQIAVPDKPSNQLKRLREVANSLLTRSLSADKEHVDRSICFGMLHLDNKKFEEAKRDFSYALVFQSDNAEALMTYGLCLSKCSTAEKVIGLNHLHMAEQKLDAATKEHVANDSFKAVNLVYHQEVQDAIKELQKPFISSKLEFKF